MGFGGRLLEICIILYIFLHYSKVNGVTIPNVLDFSYSIYLFSTFWANFRMAVDQIKKYSNFLIGGCTKARKIWSNPYYYGVTVTRLFQKPKSDETPIPTYSIVYDPLDAFFKKTQLNRTCLSCDDVIIKFGSANFKR